jgi:SSS family solute:Na+ symporter
VRVNVLQLAVKLVGFLLALLYLLTNVHWSPPVVTNVATGNSLTTPLFYLATFTPAFIISPGILQKVFAARDEQSVRFGVGLNAAGLLLFAIVPALMGSVARMTFPNLPNSELALPTLLTSALPFWLGALLLAAIFAAELSAADAVLFMLTTSLSKDLYKAHLNPNADDQRLMQIARLVAIGCGALGTLLAMWLETVYAALTIFYTLLTAALFLPMIVGLYSKRVTAKAALVSMIVSVGVTFAVHFVSQQQHYWGIPAVIFGIVAGGLAMMMWLRGARLGR